MRRHILHYVILINCLQSFAQSKQGDIEKAFPSVVYISTVKTETRNVGGVSHQVLLRNQKTNETIPATFREFGTGFLLSKDLDIYLVTAEHVAKATNLNTTVTISIEGKLSLKVPIKDLISTVYLSTDGIRWISHSSADVAVVPLDISKVKKLNLVVFPYDCILNRLEDPLRQRNLTVYGYPFGLGEDKRISPISKEYKPSSGLIDLPRFDTNTLSTFFLLDDPSIGGFSGGAVIALPQELKIEEKTYTVKTFWILGLVHGTITGQGGVGFGAIVPSKYISETIDSAPSFSGTHTFLYPNGNKWSEVIYRNGIPWTVLSNFDQSGNPQEKGTLKDGNGTRLLYSEDGKLVVIEHFRDGLKFRIEGLEQNK